MTTIAGYSAADVAYIQAEYRSMDQLCATRRETPDLIWELIDAERLPRPTYVTDGGVAMFPPDYFGLLDAAGDTETLPHYFRARYAAASARLGLVDDDGDETWASYLAGEFGVCLWSVTPEAMALKTKLMAEIDELVGSAESPSPEWTLSLRVAVDALDLLERPFTAFDLARWGGTSRESHITQMRRRFLD